MYDIRVAVEEGGFSCDPWVVRGGNDFDIESADCTDQAVFAVYDNASLIKEQRDVRLGLIFAIYDRVFDLTAPTGTSTAENTAISASSYYHCSAEK